LCTDVFFFAETFSLFPFGILQTFPFFPLVPPYLTHDISLSAMPHIPHSLSKPTPPSHTLPRRRYLFFFLFSLRAPVFSGNPSILYGTTFSFSGMDEALFSLDVSTFFSFSLSVAVFLPQLTEIKNFFCARFDQFSPHEIEKKDKMSPFTIIPSSEPVKLDPFPNLSSRPLSAQTTRLFFHAAC